MNLASSIIDTMTAEKVRRLLFYVDGLRYSFSMCALAAKRLVSTLDEIVRLREASDPAEEFITSALLDARSIIDMCHRARELVQGTSLIPQKIPGIQAFLRKTADIKEVRNYIQHLRTEIPAIPASWSPLWGAISWIPSHQPTSSYTINPGSIIEGTQAPSVVYDTHNRRFVSALMLYVGESRIDLIALSEAMRDLRIALTHWVEQHPNYEKREANTLIWRISIASPTDSGETHQ